MKELLLKLNACNQAMEWVADKSWEEIYNTCHRGDWLCWLFVRTNPSDLRLITFVKGHQANTVRHLIKDERSLAAVDAAIAFGEGRISITELDAVHATAYRAYSTLATAYRAYSTLETYGVACADAAAVTAAKTDYNASHAASHAAYAIAYSTYSALKTYEAANAANAARIENQKQTADIFRKYISIDKFNIIKL